jgi:tRNA 2-thiouridine synthesizing protein A
MGYAGLPIPVIDAFPGFSANTGSAAHDRPQETAMHFDKEFDASVLSCPMPIVKTKKSLRDMTTGQVLRVVATDPGSVCDMAAFAEETGNTLLESTTESSRYVFFLRKA